jgi:hypothetical protein
VRFPEAQEPVKVASEPLHIEGELRPVGAEGMGVTYIVVLCGGLLQAELAELSHAA